MPRRLSSEQIKEHAAKAQALAAKRRRRITILQTQLQEQTQRDHQRTLFQLGTLVEAAGLDPAACPDGDGRGHARPICPEGPGGTDRRHARGLGAGA